MPASSPRPVWVLRLFAALVFVAACVSLFTNLGLHSWATDEPVYRNAARAIFEYGNWSHNLEHPPLGKLLIGASESLLGDDVWATRFMAPASILLAGVLLGALASRMGGGMAAGIAVFATFTMLPHPVPAFDVSRLAYLDAPMLLFVAATLYAGWRWQETWSWRWAIVAGLTAGLAVATKFPALFLAAVLLVPVVLAGRGDVRRRLVQYVALAMVAAFVSLAWWLPLGGDLPRALRFAAAMQARDTSQRVELAGRVYEGAPWWAQAWWQWDAWPAMAVVLAAAIVLAWFVLPRAVAAYAIAATLFPALAYALLGTRMLPHWMATWQAGSSLLVGLVIVALVRSHRHRVPARVVAGAMTLVVLAHAADRTRDVVELERSDQIAIYEALRHADRPGRVVLDASRSIDVAPLLSSARPMPWDGTYHSAAENQHEWVRRNGGRPPEPEPGDARSAPAALAAAVTDSDAAPRGFDDAESSEVGDMFVWLRP